MIKKILIASFLLANTVLADMPIVECRFAAMDINDEVCLDEVVSYSLEPFTGVSGDFEPYDFEISMRVDTFSVTVSLAGERLSGTQRIPLQTVAVLPVGATIFGVNTVYHEPVEEFVALRYECIKVF